MDAGSLEGKAGVWAGVQRLMVPLPGQEAGASGAPPPWAARPAWEAPVLCNLLHAKTRTTRDAFNRQ